MTELKIITEVVHQSRTDKATRELSLAGAPRMTYSHSRYRFRNAEPATEERTWQPEVLRIRWSRGHLAGFKLRGHRVKKDGTVGMLADSISYDWYAERGTWLGREEYVGELKPAPDWVLQLVDAHKDNPPPFDAEQ